jgi:hypothetical protein
VAVFSISGDEHSSSVINHVVSSIRGGTFVAERHA